MINELIARKRIYENDPKRVHDRILLSDETKAYADIRGWEEQNNIKKADYLFSELNKFALPSKDSCYDRYQGIKQIDAIELINGDLHITSTTECTERDGWEICDITLDRVIMFEIHTEDNKIIRFDFQGMIDNENGYEATYTHQITDNNCYVHNSSEIKTTKLINEIKNQYECYVYTAFDDNNGNISSMDNITGYDDKYACCIEVFSDLVDPQDYDEADFGITNEYIDKIIKVRKSTEKEAENIEKEYKKEKVKTTVSKWNQGCEFGMAMYIWIPFQ